MSSVLSVSLEKIATICETKHVDEDLFNVFIHVDVDLFKVALIAYDDVEYLTSDFFFLSDKIREIYNKSEIGLYIYDTLLIFRNKSSTQLEKRNYKDFSKFKKYDIEITTERYDMQTKNKKISRRNFELKRWYFY